MSILKIVLIVGATLVVLFILLLIYTLWPKIRNVSDHKRLRQFVNTPLTIRNPAFIYKAEKGQYRFVENVLTQNDQYADSKTFDLPVGSVITIREFKTYRNDGGSGFTDVWALGEYITATGEKIEFAYDWGNIDPGLYNKQVPDLPIAPWMDSVSAPINISGPDM